jgi:hypothetical protein
VSNSDPGYFKSWYSKNKDKHNAKRRKKYAADPERRDKAVNYQRGYRAENARPSSRGEEKFRIVKGRECQVWRISDTATMAGCSAEFIRKYEAAGVIPRPLVESKQRYYTAHQVALIKDFYDLMMGLKYEKDSGLKALALQNQQQILSKNWSGE